MAKSKYIISLLLLSLILVGAKCGEEKSSQSKERDKYEDYLTYQKKDWKFEIKHPDDWEIQEIDENPNEFVVGFISPQGGTSDVFKENVLVFASLAQPQDFDELMQTGIAEMVKDEGTNVINYTNAMTSGYPSYKVRYNIKDNGIEWKYLHYFIDTGKFWYQMLYTGQDDDFDNHLKKANMTMDSLELF